MASLTRDDWSKGLRKVGEQLRKLKEENPHLFDPIQIMGIIYLTPSNKSAIF